MMTKNGKLKLNWSRVTEGNLFEQWKKERGLTGTYSELKKDYLIYYKRKYTLARRQMIIAKFGGKCVRCGFSDWRALQIDHVDGGGLKDLDNSSHQDRYYNEILRDGPEAGKHQLLCANCNWIKREEMGEKRGGVQ